MAALLPDQAVSTLGDSSRRWKKLLHPHCLDNPCCGVVTSPVVQLGHLQVIPLWEHFYFFLYILLPCTLILPLERACWRLWHWYLLLVILTNPGFHVLLWHQNPAESSWLLISLCQIFIKTLLAFGASAQQICNEYNMLEPMEITSLLQYISNTLLLFPGGLICILKGFSAVGTLRALVIFFLIFYITIVFSHYCVKQGAERYLYINLLLWIRRTFLKWIVGLSPHVVHIIPELLEGCVQSSFLMKLN